VLITVAVHDFFIKISHDRCVYVLSNPSYNSGFYNRRGSQSCIQEERKENRPICHLNVENFKQNLSVFNERQDLYLHIFSFSWRDSPLVGLGLLLIHEDFCGFYLTHNDTP